MDYPKISIVTPSFNQAQFLEETIVSIISQNYPNLEYIIIDGGSTDGSVEIIKKYEKHLTYWVSEPDNGHGHALNKGFAKTTGEIMAWLNSDDKYYPWTFQTVAEIFQKFDDVEWIMGRPSVFDSVGRIVYTTERYNNILDILFNTYEHIQQESVFWKRSLWEKAGAKISNDYKFMIDTELWVRFFEYTELWHIDLVIGGYRRHDNNRAILNNKLINNELSLIFNHFFERADYKFKNTYYKFIQYIESLKIISNLKNKIYNKKIYKLLPNILYSKIVNYKINTAKKKYLKKFKFDENFNYKILTLSNSNFEKDNKLINISKLIDIYLNK